MLWGSEEGVYCGKVCGVFLRGKGWDALLTPWSRLQELQGNLGCGEDAFTELRGIGVICAEGGDSAFSLRILL